MFKKNKKNNIIFGLFLTPYFFTLACLIILAAIIQPVYKNALERHEVDKEVLDLQKQIASLEAGNDDLKKLKVYLESDQFAEREARLDLGLKKAGEQVAVIENIGAGKVEDNLGAAYGFDKNKNSNPVKWWNYLFGR